MTSDRLCKTVLGAKIISGRCGTRCFLESRSFLAWIVLADSAVIRDRSTGCISGALNRTINRRGCAAGASRYNPARQWNHSPIISEFGNRKGKVRPRLMTHFQRSATRGSRPVLFFLLVLPSTNGSIYVYLDRQDLAAGELDLTMLLALVEPAIRVMRNRFRLGARLMCTDLISHG